MADNDGKEKRKVFSFFVVGLLIVEEKKRVVVERFGEYCRTLDPGLRLILFPGILDRIKDEIFIEQETIPLFPEPIKIDFKDGSATPKNVRAYIEIDRPDDPYLTKKEAKEKAEKKKAEKEKEITDKERKKREKKERKKRGIGGRTGVFRAVYHIRKRKEAIRDRLENAVRSYLNKLTIQEGIEMARGGYDLLGPNGISKKETNRLKGVFEDWGTIVHAITIGDFDLEPDLVRARGELHKRLKEREAAKDVAKRRAKETVGVLIEMITEQTGISQVYLQKMLKENPNEFITKYKDLLKQNLDLIHRRMAIDGDSFVDIRVDGAQGVEKMLLNLFAAKERMPMGGKEPPGPKKEGSKEETEEEKDEKLFEDLAEKSRALKKVKAR